MLSVIMPNSHVGSFTGPVDSDSITHGATLSSHETPLSKIGPPQQLDPPGARAPHPTPPQ